MNKREKLERAECCIDAARFYLNAVFGEGVDSQADWLPDLQKLITDVDLSQDIVRKILRELD